MHDLHTVDIEISPVFDLSGLPVELRCTAALRFTRLDQLLSHIELSSKHLSILSCSLQFTQNEAKDAILLFTPQRLATELILKYTIVDLHGAGIRWDSSAGMLYTIANGWFPQPIGTGRSFYSLRFPESVHAVCTGNRVTADCQAFSTDHALAARSIGFLCFTGAEGRFPRIVLSEPRCEIYMLKAPDFIVPKIDEILTHFADLLDSAYPFDTCAVAYVNELSKSILFGNLLLVPFDWLFTARMIEEVYAYTTHIVRTLALSWIESVLFIEHEQQDRWIVQAYTAWLEKMYLETVFGRVYHEFLLLEDLSRPYTTDVAVKTKIIVKILELKMGRDAFQECMQSMLVICPLSTHGFLTRLCKLHPNLSGEFRRCWKVYVYNESKTWPAMAVAYNFNARTRSIDITLNASNLAAEECILQVCEVSRQYMKRVDMAPSGEISVSFPCASTVLRNRKRKRLTLQEVKALPVMKLISRVNELPISYARFDPLDLLFVIPKIQTSPAMLIQQLCSESTNLKAQYEALHNLAKALFRYKIPQECDLDEVELCRLVLRAFIMDETKFWKLRSLAIRVFIQLSSKYAQYRDEILQIFAKKFAYADDHTALRMNDFSNFTDYFLRKEIIASVSQLRGKDKRSPEWVVQFIQWVVNDNQNQANAYSDDLYRCNLIHSLSNLRLEPEKQKSLVLDHLERLYRYDQVCPSSQHCVTEAILVACEQMLRRNHQMSLPFGDDILNVFIGPERRDAWSKCVHSQRIQFAAWKCFLRQRRSSELKCFLADLTLISKDRYFAAKCISHCDAHKK